MARSLDVARSEDLSFDANVFHASAECFLKRGKEPVGFTDRCRMVPDVCRWATEGSEHVVNNRV